MIEFKYLKVYFFLLLMPLLQCCQSPSIVKFAIFIDTTDSLNQKWQVESCIEQILIKSKLDAKQGGENGIEVTLYAINNLSENPGFKVPKLPLGDAMGSNHFVRSDQIKKFTTDFKLKFEEFKTKNSFGQSQSRIYQNLCNYFKSSAKQKPIVIIFSDMVEHSEHLSFYGTENQSKIRSAIHENMKKLDNELGSKTGCQLPPDLSNTEIHIVFDRNSKNNSVIDLSSLFWKEFFKLKKNNISFGSTLNLNN